MKYKIVILTLSILIVSCTSVKKSLKPDLYEVLLNKDDGGGNINFYEVISDSIEFKMLLADKNLRKKIHANDIKNANFLIMNMGPKNKKGCSIAIEEAEEKEDRIIIKVVEKESKNSNTLTDEVFPFSIIKINSKKTIELKK